MLRAKRIVLAGIPAWASGADLWKDFTRNLGNMADSADTHAATIYQLNRAGVYIPKVANALAQETSVGLQTVPTAAQMLTAPTDLTNAAWTQTGLTVTADQDTAPDGTVTADLINITASGANNNRQQVTVTASTHYVFYFWAKRGTATNLKYSVFDVSNSVDIVAATDYFSSTNASTYSLIAVQFTTNVGCTSVFVYTTRDSASTGTFYAWGANMILGDVPVPPILSLATVNGNQQVVTPYQSFAPGAATEITVDVLGLHDGDWLWQDNDGSSSNRAGIRQSSGQFQFVVDSGGVNQAALNLGAVATGVQTFAAVYGTNYAMAQKVGGSAPSADTTVTMPVSMTKLNLGGLGYATTNNGYSNIKRLAKTFQAADATTFAASLQRATLQAVAA